MFTELGKIWTHNIRKTDPTDTHEYIREHTRDHQKQGHPDDENRSDMFDSDDHTEVSVVALDAFLQSVLRNHPDNDAKPSLHDAAMEIQTPKVHKREAAPPMRGAVNAYEHAAETSQSPSRYEISEEQSSALNLTSEDVQDIKDIVQGLQTLKKYNIQTIEITVGNSFLSGLKIAIEKALNPNS